MYYKDAEKIIQNAIRNTHEELAKENEVPVHHFVFKEDIPKKKHHKIADKFDDVGSCIVAFMDTSFWGNASEGFLITSIGFKCKGWMREGGVKGTSIKPLFFDSINNKIQKIEVDPENGNYSYIYVNYQPKKRVYNSIYNAYVTRVLNDICSAFAQAEAKTEVKETKVEEVVQEDIKTQVNPLKAEDFVGNEKYMELYSYVNGLCDALYLYYKISLKTDVEEIKQCMDQAEVIFEDAKYDRMYHLLKKGFVNYVYLADETCTQKDNLDCLKQLAYVLFEQYNCKPDEDYLEYAAICAITRYENGKVDLLDKFVTCALLMMQYNEDTSELFDILETSYRLYKKMVKENLYEKGVQHIFINDIFASYYFDMGKDMQKKNPQHIDCKTYFERATFCKKQEAYFELAKIYHFDYKDDEKAFQLLLERDMLALMTTIVDEPKGIDDLFDEACEKYKKGEIDDCYYSFLLTTFVKDDGNEDIQDMKAASHYNKGILLLRSIEGDEDYDEAVKQFYLATTYYQDEARFMLAILYLNGLKEASWDDEKCNTALVLHTYTPLKLYYLAKCHREGIGTPKDEKMAYYMEKRYKDYYLSLLEGNERKEILRGNY